MGPAGGTVSNSPVTTLRDPWKVWSSHTIGYYSAIERKEIWFHATTWVHLENMLTERNRSQKD